MHFIIFNCVYKTTLLLFLACQLDSSFKPTKNTYVCSRHFKRENFTSQVTGKIVLKCLTVPTIFPWNKHTVVVVKTESLSVSKPSSPPAEKKSENEDIKPAIKVEANVKVEPSTKSEECTKAEPNTRRNGSSVKKKPTPLKSPVKPKKSSQRLSAKVVKLKPENPLATPERIKTSPSVATPKKKNQVVNFVPGSSIEAQNFDGKWMPVKVIEVDMEEREVLVRSCDKNNKSKTG